MNKVKFNINNYIYILLDADGEQIFKDACGTSDISFWKSDAMPGYYRLRFWQFINIFGGHSRGSYVPYSTEVYLDNVRLLEE